VVRWRGVQACQAAVVIRRPGQQPLAYPPIVASRPSSPDRESISRLHARVGVLAERLAHDRAGVPAAVAELSTTIPPCRVDVVNQVLANYARRDSYLPDWPPMARLAELLFKVRAVTRGEVPLRGEHGEVVRHVEYTDRLGVTRRVLRLTRRGVHVGDFPTVEELGEHVDLAELVGDRQPEEPEPPEDPQRP
jgi:hypothetical protein